MLRWRRIGFRGVRRRRRRCRGGGGSGTPGGLAAGLAEIAAAEELKAFEDDAELAAFLAGLFVIPLIEPEPAFHEERAALFHVLRQRLGLAAKRALDLAGSAFLLLVLSPLFALLAVLVKLDSRGATLFRQERVGLHGRPFRVIKFRTMCSDAEQKLDDLRGLNIIRGHAFKMRIQLGKGGRQADRRRN